jgi:hypothetical protein
MLSPSSGSAEFATCLMLTSFLAFFFDPENEG